MPVLLAMENERLETRDATILSALLKGDLASPNRERLMRELSEQGKQFFERVERAKNEPSPTKNSARGKKR